MELNGAPAAHPSEFPFTLPQGLLDPDGGLHREGAMRLATAFDEIEPLKDPRVRANPGYLVIILLSRVIGRLGEVTQLNPKVVEGLFSADLAYLQDFYNRINGNGTPALKVVCPRCQEGFDVEPERPGES